MVTILGHSFLLPFIFGSPGVSTLGVFLAHTLPNKPYTGMTINEITVGQFQAVYSIQKGTGDELDKITDMVAILTGRTAAEVDDMSLSEFNTVSREIRAMLENPLPEAKPKRIIKANGKEYWIIYEPGKLRAGQYVEYQGWIKGDIIENLHLIMASISYPFYKFGPIRKKGKNDSTKHEQVANDFKEAKLIDVYSACVFFCELLKGSIKATEDFLVRELKGKATETEVRQTITDLLAALDGFTPQSRLQSLKG